MSALSADSQKSWKTTPQERPPGLEIVLLKRTYVLPWNQFLYAEGGDEEIRLAFHDSRRSYQRNWPRCPTYRFRRPAHRPSATAHKSRPFF